MSHDDDFEGIILHTKLERSLKYAMQKSDEWLSIYSVDFENFEHVNVASN